MTKEILILILEAMAIYCLVLGAHSLRYRFGPVHFFALIGGITAIMSWITDAGATVQVGSITFVVGSTVFYTALLLGVFVVYVFDGPRATRVAISTVVGVSIMVPLVSLALHFQTRIIGHPQLALVPLPNLRINCASVVTTIVDLFFLGIAWEFLGKPHLKMALWSRAFLTLLGVMWMDVLLFSTGAFAGTPAYLGIMKGTLINRFIISVFALPLLYAYLHWQSQRKGVKIENRPVLAILKQVAEIKEELNLAQREIKQRKKAEQERDQFIQELRKTLLEVKTLRGLIPICSHCKSIRDDQGYWKQLERYLHEHSNAQFSHGICPTCAQKIYPNLMTGAPPSDEIE